MTRLAIFLCLLIHLSSCNKESDLPFPTTGRQVVLNGILDPDSTIRVTLTETIPLDEAPNFPVITDASVVLYEDDRIVDTLMFQKNKYILDYYPQAGKEYRIEAQVPTYGVVRASDLIPSPPIFNVCYQQDTNDQYMFADAIINISIYNPEQEAHSYWVDITSIEYDYRVCEEIEDSLVCDNGSPVFFRPKTEGYESYSTLPDPFNSYINNIAGGVRAYDEYIRINSEAATSKIIELDIASPTGYNYLATYRSLHDSLSYSLNVINASEAYDRYLKSSITYYLAFDYGNPDDQRPNSFAEPIEIYSNVENGTGIFAAYNSTSLEIGDYPCP